jgi:hypothetical protein
MGIAPGTPAVVQKPAPTLQDRQQAYYQALSHSRDPSVAASARDHLMQLEERQAVKDEDTSKKDKMGKDLLALVPPGASNIRAAVQAQISVGDYDGAAKTLGDSLSGPAGKTHVTLDPETKSWVAVHENADGTLSGASSLDAYGRETKSVNGVTYFRTADGGWDDGK